MKPKSVNRSRSAGKTKHSLSKTKSNCEEIKENAENSKQIKKIWSFERMVEVMQPTSEELYYRSRKSTELNPVEKYSKLFKCTKCQKNLKNFIVQNKKAPLHPCLGVLMCEKCCSYYEDGEFSLDSDGEDKYCRWCGEGGTLFSCSKCICGFCANCIKNHFSFKFFKTVQSDENWLCFFCDPKPLWDQRYICSLAIQMAEESKTPTSSTSVQQKQQLKQTTNPKGNTSEERETVITSEPCKQNKQKNSYSDGNMSEENKELLSSITLEEKEDKEEGKQDEEERKEDEEGDDDEEGKEGEEEGDDDEEVEEIFFNRWSSKQKRKHVYTDSSSGDETDCKISEMSPKKFKFASNPLKNLLDAMESDAKESAKLRTLSELQKLLKLSQYQMNLGASWCSDSLTKLTKADRKITEANLLEECKKIKWFFSVLSTYLIQFSNSVDSLQKSLCQDEGMTVPSNIKEKEESPYTIILQFLGFLNNQVKIFAQRGVTFSDVIDAALYEDENVIGIKKKSSSRNKNADSASRQENLANDDIKITESKESDDLCDISGGAYSSEFETEQNNDNFMEIDSIPYVSFAEASNSKTLESTQEIQKLISILENA